MDNLKRTERREFMEEAVKRMRLLGVKEEEAKMYRDKGEIPASFADYRQKKAGSFTLEQEEKETIARLEKDKGFLVYYAMMDTGRWPDGSTFERQTFLIVSDCKEDWGMEQDIITRYGNVLAYVYNCEEPSCSETCEIPFRNIGGALINAG